MRVTQAFVMVYPELTVDFCSAFPKIDPAIFEATCDRPNHMLSVGHLPRTSCAVSCAMSFCRFCREDKTQFAHFDFFKFADFAFLIKTDPMTAPASSHRRPPDVVHSLPRSESPLPELSPHCSGMPAFQDCPVSPLHARLNVVPMRGGWRLKLKP
jgi:hypothetical protein